MTNQNKKVVTFGEVMMRLSPPGFAKFSQANSLVLEYGGGEANVAISLAYFGMRAAHVTRFPDNYIGRAATQFLRRHWLDTSAVLYGGDMLGKYFVEKGAVHRPSRVVYERDGSAFSEIDATMFDWETILDGADWFHWTGITPGISKGAAEACKKAIEVANAKGLTVSADINSRKNLWNYGKKPSEMMPDLIAGTDIIIGGYNDIKEVYNIEVSGSKKEKFCMAAQALIQICPRVKKVFDKERKMISASHNTIQGEMWGNNEFHKSPKLDITHIIDRIGTGDAYAAGVIYGLLHYKTDQEALDFANAACALKHTVEGDVNMVSAEDVEFLMQGNTSGKIIR
ncbi:MAG: sugar kinase [Cyclobacteriaceae bacterium]|nr:sugar kinase [Cyclobacteriaceae bacterium SS2]